MQLFFPLFGTPRGTRFTQVIAVWLAQIDLTLQLHIFASRKAALSHRQVLPGSRSHRRLPGAACNLWDAIFWGATKHRPQPDPFRAQGCTPGTAKPAKGERGALHPPESLPSTAPCCRARALGGCRPIPGPAALGSGRLWTKGHKGQQNHQSRKAAREVTWTPRPIHPARSPSHGCRPLSPHTAPGGAPTHLWGQHPYPGCQPADTCGYLREPGRSGPSAAAGRGARPLSAPQRPAPPGPARPAGAGGGRGPGGRAPPAVAAAPAPLPSDPGQNFSAAGEEPGGRGCPGRAAPRFTPAAPLVESGIEPSPEHPGAGRAAPGTAPADLFPPQPVRPRSFPSLSRDAPGWERAAALGCSRQLRQHSPTPVAKPAREGE